MKTFKKITLLFWALTVCMGGQNPETFPDNSSTKASLAQKTTHSCEVTEASQRRQKA